MKTLKLLAVVFTALLSVQVFAQEQILTIDQTPEPIKSYVKNNFPENKILFVKKDKDFSKVDYEVKLEGNIELKFDKSFNITDIESETALPNKVVSKKIRTFVSEKFPNNVIVAWEKEGKREKVELDSELELYFDKAGKFLNYIK